MSYGVKKNPMKATLFRFIGLVLALAVPLVPLMVSVGAAPAKKSVPASSFASERAWQALPPSVREYPAPVLDAATEHIHPFAPTITVTPTDFISITAVISYPVIHTLVISNPGDALLDFEIHELPPPTFGVMGVRSYRQMPAAVAVDPFIYERFALSSDGKADYFIAFKGTADLTPAYSMDWSERGRFVVQALQEAANAAQADVKVWLDGQGIEYTSCWINNTVFVHADEATLSALATFSEVSGFMGNHVYQVMPVKTSKTAPDNRVLSPAYPWNITFPGADRVHADFDLRGEGIVIGGIDTGVDYDHIGLVQNYRGCLDPPACTIFDHTYSWHNPGDDECGDGAPCDTDTDDGHGTATHGVMTGDDDPSLPKGAWTGMAPNAKWIHCLGLPYGSGTDVEVNECAQWFLAPGGDPDMRPHVVNHSWGSWSPDDCEGNWYAPAQQAYRAADIFPAFAAGNVGDWVNPPHCWSSTSPANNTDAGGNSLAFASGAHGSDGSLDYYSSGGPSACNNDNLFPDLVAPGLGSCTTDLNDAYTCSFGGTSAASPHTAGCVALVRQAAPWLTVAEVEQILRNTADDVDDGCGQPNESSDWNNKYGEGHLDCYEAVEVALQQDLPWVWEDPITGTVPSLGAVEVDVAFHCTEEGDHEGTLRILHNDPSEDPVDVPIVLHCLQIPEGVEWEKMVGGEPWHGGLTVTVETSSTVQVVDVISTSLPLTLTEVWDPAHLELIGYDLGPSAGAVVTADGWLEWEVPSDTVAYTLTKLFHVEPCTWTVTTLSETLEVAAMLVERPIVVEKLPSALEIESAYDPEVWPGEVATFMLIYSNVGGFENVVGIRSEFPPEARFIWSEPPPDAWDGLDGLWAEWDIGGLATGDWGAITITVAISEGVCPSTTIEIWDGILNHVGEAAGETLIQFHVRAPEPNWQKLVYVNGGPTVTRPIAVLSGDIVEVVDRVWATYTAGITFTLVETWTESLGLIGWAADIGGVAAGADTVTWDVVNAAPNAWYAITKTFHVLTGTWDTDAITESLWVADADSQPTDRVVEFAHQHPDITVSPLSLSVTLNAGDTAARTLAIGNVGAANLTWIMAEIPNVAWLSGVPTGGIVTPMGSNDVVVTFIAPSAVGVYTATLRVSSNDLDEPTVDVPVTLATSPRYIYLPIIRWNS